MEVEDDTGWTEVANLRAASGCVLSTSSHLCFRLRESQQTRAAELCLGQLVPIGSAPPRSEDTVSAQSSGWPFSPVYIWGSAAVSESLVLGLSSSLHLG